jgi:hypothetical protein
MNLATPSYDTPFMVAPFIDLRNGDAKNLIYLVLSGLPPGPLCVLRYLTLYTVLQEMEDSLQLPKYIYVFYDNTT